jgi:tripartite-type tricarboxylate transporter receptor subunit TctC
VPYRNVFASLPDLAQGRIDFVFIPLSPLLGAAQGGQARLIAVASPDRAPLAPEVPTAAEAGFPSLSLPGGHGLFAPREMPALLRARIAEEVRAALAKPEVARRLAVLAYIPRTGTPAEFAAMLEAERARWTEVARLYGARPPQ